MHNYDGYPLLFFYCNHPIIPLISICTYLIRMSTTTVLYIQSKDAKQIAQDNNKGGDGVWIDNEDDLAQLCTRITEGQENGDIHDIALDLEAHSHRSFAGPVGLVQLSIRRSPTTSDDQSTSSIDTGYDSLIDDLSLRHAIPTQLGPILANPNILKVMHGADSDIPCIRNHNMSHITFNAR